MKNIINWKTQIGEAIDVADVTLIPQTQVLEVRLPFSGFVWNRPTAVTVERDGRVETFPIIDVTRSAIWALLGFSFLISFIIYRNKISNLREAFRKD